MNRGMQVVEELWLKLWRLILAAVGAGFVSTVDRLSALEKALVIGSSLAALSLLRIVVARTASDLVPVEPTPAHSPVRRAAAGAGALAFACVAVWPFLFRAARLEASCSWSRDPANGPQNDESVALSCVILNRGATSAQEVVLELPFLCSRASADGVEASGRFDKSVFVADPKPPAPFSLGEIRAGRKVRLLFFPALGRLSSVAGRLCQPSAYSLIGAETVGRVELSGCATH